MNGDELDPNAEGDEPGGDEARPGDEAPADAEDAQQRPVRGRRRKLRIAKAEDLGTWDYMQAHDPEGGIEVVLTGDGILGDRAEASKVGAAIEHIAKLWRELGGSSPFISSLAFEGSVHITLEASRTEVSRARRELERARKLRAEDAPTEEVRAALSSSIPDVEIAAALAGDLLSAPVDETPLRAAEFGQDVAGAMKSLATSLAREGLTVSLTAPDRDDPVRLTSTRAARVAEVLRTVQEPREFNVVAIGTLSMADALHRQFALALDPSAERPRILKGRRIVRGGYAREMGDVIRDNSYWGKKVAATIRVRRDVVISTSKVRPPIFTLIGVSASA